MGRGLKERKKRKSPSVFLIIIVYFDSGPCTYCIFIWYWNEEPLGTVRIVIKKKKIETKSSSVVSGWSDNIVYIIIYYYYVCVRWFRVVRVSEAATDIIIWQWQTTAASSGHGAFLFFSRTDERRDRQQTTNIIYMHIHIYIHI